MDPIGCKKDILEKYSEFKKKYRQTIEQNIKLSELFGQLDILIPQKRTPTILNKINNIFYEIVRIY